MYRTLQLYLNTNNRQSYIAGTLLLQFSLLPLSEGRASQKTARGCPRNQLSVPETYSDVPDTDSQVWVWEGLTVYSPHHFTCLANPGASDPNSGAVKEVYLMHKLDAPLISQTLICKGKDADGWIFVSNDKLPLGTLKLSAKALKLSKQPGLLVIWSLAMSIYVDKCVCWEAWSIGLYEKRKLDHMHLVGNVDAIVTQHKHAFFQMPHCSCTPTWSKAPLTSLSYFSGWNALEPLFPTLANPDVAQIRNGTKVPNRRFKLVWKQSKLANP